MRINPNIGTIHIPEFIIPPIRTDGRDNKAKLFSLGITGSVCMKFYFYVYGNETGHLKILVSNYRSHKDPVVFHRYGNHGHKWNFAQVYLDSVPTAAYQVLRSKLVPQINLIKLYQFFILYMGKYAVKFDHQNIRYRHPVAFKAQIAQFAIIFSA
jgi:hypothetical protein